MLDDLYSDRLLQAAASLPPARRLDAPCASARKMSRVCGSEIVIDLAVEDGVVADFGLEAKACALGQASAALVAQRLVGAAVDGFQPLRDTMRAMLKEDGPPPSEERWRELEWLRPISAYPQRHASTLLVFEALAECAVQLNGDAAQLRPKDGAAAITP